MNNFEIINLLLTESIAEFNEIIPWQQLVIKEL